MKDEAREERIEKQIVVDAYGEKERAIGWHCYLQDSITFPFKAECIATRKTSLLRQGDKVNLFEMSPEDACTKEFFVQIKWKGREMSVPLAQLKPMAVDHQTLEAVENWQYWVDMGHEF
ncbi:MAG: calcium-binding protein [Chloroflexi bacterium]|nr:calcium-binding protein [Chloroflexota bacterium]